MLFVKKALRAFFTNNICKARAAGVHVWISGSCHTRLL